MLREIKNKSVAKVEHFALAIMKSTPDQSHSGICFQDENGYWLVHLRWHHKLSYRDFCLKFQWSPVKRHRSVLKQLAIITGMIACEEPVIPYGFRPEGITFDKDTGVVCIAGDGSGLTCATFILAVFDSIGLRLLKKDEWPEDANEAWQASIVSTLERTEDVSAGHLEAVRADVGKMRRFTPEEVLAAASMAAWPVGFKVAQAEAQKLAKLINPYTPTSRFSSC